MADLSLEEDEEITGINVTPLVDVMLVLLIIFMATTTYIVHQSIKVSLPQADTGSSTFVKKNLSFLLDQSAALYADGKPILFDQVREYIDNERKAAEKESRSLQALISADKDTPHGAVIKLIDEVRKNGIKDFAIHVESSAK
ncbi:MAG: biopolymer transporter ExbD [Deltaproteobacteria bacterium]|nr:biopolymer transporter ExbD [Deltaproteobacteria bacterium]